MSGYDLSLLVGLVFLLSHAGRGVGFVHNGGSTCAWRITFTPTFQSDTITFITMRTWVNPTLLAIVKFEFFRNPNQPAVGLMFNGGKLTYAEDTEEI